MKNILIVFGTRPEAIKMIPLVGPLKCNFNVYVCVTGQHRQLLDQVLRLYDIKPEFDLNIMKKNQTISEIMSGVLIGVQKVLLSKKFDCVLVHGDTSTSAAAALSSFYLNVPVGHVEAGLRTWNINSPFPEELNRQLITKVARFHFAPSEQSKKNLLLEKAKEEDIFVVGNTVIDALFNSLDIIKKRKLEMPLINDQNIFNSKKKIILVTGHRRENFGKGFIEICEGLKKVANHYGDVIILFPMHFNPKVRDLVKNSLGNIKNIILTDPFDYFSFLKVMELSHIILTDSGGIQEEAPALGKPVLVLRENTERPEAIECGTVKLVGPNSKNIFKSVSLLLESKKIYNLMSNAKNPYGSGDSSKTISAILKKKFEISEL